MLLRILGSILIISVNSAPMNEKTNLINPFEFFSSNDGEFGGHFEGDMLLTPAQQRAILDASDTRNGLRGSSKRWPENTVVYHIVEDDFDDVQVNEIESAMADISNKSCIKFRARKNEEEHSVLIKSSGNGCYSNVGYNIPDENNDDVKQVLNLQKGCLKHGIIVHEMLHTLGFYHMQSTYDRDDYVSIVWKNIRPGTEHNFAKYNNDTVTDFGVEYDYMSVMHYPEKAFSINGERTIIPLQANVTIGQRSGMSPKDILKLNKMYCKEQEVP